MAEDGEEDDSSPEKRAAASTGGAREPIRAWGHVIKVAQSAEARKQSSRTLTECSSTPNNRLTRNSSCEKNLAIKTLDVRSTRER